MKGSLAGKRILVVEDEYFIASDLKRALQKEDALVIGPAADIGRGLGLVKDNVIDAAILNVNLEGATSFPIADELSHRNVPYVFLTGYDGWALPEGYRASPRIAKPFATHAVVAWVGSRVGSEMAS